MHNLLPKISIQVNPNIYLKDPESSDLGRKIISGSIDLIDDMGFNAFTFRKLASKIETTEASIYRYFESKHKLLLYLTAWYWAWMEYRLVFSISNISDPADRLGIAIDLLTVINEDSEDWFNRFEESKLNRIIYNESSKVYLTKEVDVENKEGVFLGYKELVGRISEIILEINPNFKYPHMLVSTMIEGSHQQRFFAQHLPRLTDNIKGEDSINCFYKQMVFELIEPKG